MLGGVTGLRPGFSVELPRAQHGADADEDGASTITASSPTAIGELGSSSQRPSASTTREHDHRLANGSGGRLGRS